MNFFNERYDKIQSLSKKISYNDLTVIISK